MYLKFNKIMASIVNLVLVKSTYAIYSILNGLAEFINDHVYEWAISVHQYFFSKYRFICIDCKCNTHDRYERYYYVKDDVWEQAGLPKDAISCIRCLEKRIGRKLCKNDFKNCSLNTELANRSLILMDRMSK